MSKENSRSYSKEFKAQIIKECVETNNYAVVLKKYDVPATTVCTCSEGIKINRKRTTGNHNELWKKNWQTQSLRSRY